MIDLKECLILGIVGNYAKHLEQAKEVEFFKDLNVSKDKPKGIFVIYSKDCNTFLNRFCVDNHYLSYKENIQAEAELALLCKTEYKNNLLHSLKVTHFCAFNDASLRINENFISKKKNFSTSSKACGNFIEFKDFNDLAQYKISSFVCNDNKEYEYGSTENIKDYLCYGDELLQWICKSVNEQKTKASLEELLPYFKNQPKHILISIGATPYSDYALNNPLKVGDKIKIIVSNNINKSELIQEIKL